jgi:UDP-glucose 4-epimerase
MKIAVTGGAGFIGSNLVRAASIDPSIEEITVIDDLSTGLRSNLDGIDVTLVDATITDRAALESAFAGNDAVVHLAAVSSVPRSLQDPVASHHSNVTGTVCVLEAARHHGIKHVVMASSSSVYGANPALPKAELTWTAPLSPYAASKLAAESYALAYQTSFGLPMLALRFFNVFGPAQRHDHAYAAVIPRFVHAALSDEPVTIHGDGSQTRDFTYVGTVCDVILDAIRRSVTHPHPVNLAFGEQITLNSLVDEIAEATGKAIAREYGPRRVGDVAHSLADSRLLRTLFPDVVPLPLATGLRRTVEWFVDNSLTVGGVL